MVAQPTLAKELAMPHLGKRLLSVTFGLLAFLPATLLAQQNLSSPTPFITPTGLEPAVEFWKKIFTEYSASQLVFFDPLDMSMVMVRQFAGAPIGKRNLKKTEAHQIRAKRNAEINEPAWNLEIGRDLIGVH